MVERHSAKKDGGRSVRTLLERAEDGTERNGTEENGLSRKARLCESNICALALRYRNGSKLSK